MSGNALEGMREAGPYIGLGFQLFAAIALFTGGGYWLDTKLGTLPGLTLAGAGVAFGVIIFLVVRMANDANTSASRSAASSTSSDEDATDRSAGSGSSSSGRSSLRGGPDFHSGHKRRMSSDD